MKLQTQDGKDLSPKEMLSYANIVIKIGAVFAAIALLLIAYTLFMNSLTIQTSGTVISNGSRPTSYYDGNIGGWATDASRLYMPTFQFIDEDGVTHNSSLRFEDTLSDYEIGETMTIGYDPDDFRYIRITSWHAHWGFPALFFSMALLCFWFAFSLKKSIKK